ncbi:MAG: DUF1416 domain-containing protein [Actinomycetota bacterium]|nr:DUF1416 domain-containing protein [Actinomycetota bacterium]
MCGAPDQNRDLAGVDPAKETVIQGVVTAAGAPVSEAYVRLLDSTGEFTAEVVSSASGTFRFFAAPGDWTLRALSSRGRGEVGVAAGVGVTEATLPLSA